MTKQRFRIPASVVGTSGPVHSASTCQGDAPSIGWAWMPGTRLAGTRKPVRLGRVWDTQPLQHRCTHLSLAAWACLRGSSRRSLLTNEYREARGDGGGGRVGIQTSPCDSRLIVLFPVPPVPGSGSPSSKGGSLASLGSFIHSLHSSILPCRTPRAFCRQGCS